MPVKYGFTTNSHSSSHFHFRPLIENGKNENRIESIVKDPIAPFTSKNRSRWMMMIHSIVPAETRITRDSVAGKVNEVKSGRV